MALFRSPLRLLRQLLLVLLLISAFTLLVIGGSYLWLYQTISQPPVADPSKPLLDWLVEPALSFSGIPQWEAEAVSHRDSPVSLEQFQKPALTFGPWTRWWWPGNLVTHSELERELTNFASKGIAGVEVQPFAIALTPQDLENPDWQEKGWDSPDFYRNLHFTLDKARDLGLGVDLNNGSGWPTGGPHVALEDGLLQLLHSEHPVSGPTELDITLPLPAMPLATFAAGAIGLAGDTPMQTFALDKRALVAVVAARVLVNQRKVAPWNFKDQIQLDPATLIDISSQVSGEQLRWTVPDGDWLVIALWQLPGGELVAGGHAHPRPGYVVDHLDAPRLRANQDYLFRSDTGLADYFGDPLRAIFNDSLEFRQERHWARDHVSTFAAQKGYDPLPLLPSLIQPGADQMPFHAMNIETLPEYNLGLTGERFREDWLDVTSSLFDRHYFQTLYDWTQSRGIAHRLQAYGGPVDVIRAASASQIPEAEQLYAGGSRMFLNAVASGAAIAERPIVSAESFIFMGRGFMTTPLKVKALADKAFSAGINQLIYHGSSYRIDGDEDRGYPERDGWYPWQLGMLSMDYSEHWPFWAFSDQLNRYIARNQYLLRKGHYDADVAFLFPGLTFPQGYGNPQEPLDQGVFQGEPDAVGAPGHDKANSSIRAIWTAAREHEKAGLTWAWINEHSLQSARFENGELIAGGLRVRSLQLHNIEALEPETAEHIAALARSGLPVALTGKQATRQRGLVDYKRGDIRVRSALSQLPAHPPTAAPVRYQHNVVRSQRRRLVDGGLIQFFNNPQAQPTLLSVAATDRSQTAVWLNSWRGTAKRAQADAKGHYQIHLPAWGSALLWLSPTEQNLPLQRFDTDAIASQLLEWVVQAPDGQSLHQGELPGDWRTVPALARRSTAADYLSRFEHVNSPPGQRTLVQLQGLLGAAEVFVNDSLVGALLVPPFEIDITDYLQRGQNELRLRIHVSRKNRIAAEIEAGLPGWDSPDLGFDADTVAIGLLGPVNVLHRTTTELADAARDLPL